MALNIANIDNLLAFMRALPPEHFSMEEPFPPTCGTPGCILGCSLAVFNSGVGTSINLPDRQFYDLCCPEGYDEASTTGNFPLARAIDVVQYLRDTGEVDWDRFPASLYRNPPASPKLEWTPPVVIAIEPELPESLTSLLRQPVEASP